MDETLKELLDAIAKEQGWYSFDESWGEDVLKEALIRTWDMAMKQKQELETLNRMLREVYLPFNSQSPWGKNA